MVDNKIYKVINNDIELIIIIVILVFFIYVKKPKTIIILGRMK